MKHARIIVKYDGISKEEIQELSEQGIEFEKFSLIFLLLKEDYKMYFKVDEEGQLYSTAFYELDMLGVKGSNWKEVKLSGKDYYIFVSYYY